MLVEAGGVPHPSPWGEIRVDRALHELELAAIVRGMRDAGLTPRMVLRVTFHRVDETAMVPVVEPGAMLTFEFLEFDADDRIVLTPSGDVDVRAITTVVA